MLAHRELGQIAATQGRASERRKAIFADESGSSWQLPAQCCLQEVCFVRMNARITEKTDHVFPYSQKHITVVNVCNECPHIFHGMQKGHHLRRVWQYRFVFLTQGLRKTRRLCLHKMLESWALKWSYCADREGDPHSCGGTASVFSKAVSCVNI